MAQNVRSTVPGVQQILQNQPKTSNPLYLNGEAVSGRAEDYFAVVQRLTR